MTYAHRWTSARILTWWRATYPDRRWWGDASLTMGYIIRTLRGDVINPRLAEQCERVRWLLVEDMAGES